MTAYRLARVTASWPCARDCLLALRAQLEMVKHQIFEADRRILAWHGASEISRRLDDIPGVGPLIATALVASIPDPHAFKSGRAGSRMFLTSCSPRSSKRIGASLPGTV